MASASRLSPPSRDALVEHCLELLSSVGTPSAQRMFGGHGLRVDGHFVALIAFDRLYLKVDAQTRERFAAAGCEPFVYAGQRKPVTLGYWSAPPQAMDSPEAMRAWARLALDAARRGEATSSRRRAPRPVTGSEKIPRATARKR